MNVASVMLRETLPGADVDAQRVARLVFLVSGLYV